MQMRQLLLIKVAAEEPEHELDFDNAFCFDCARQELYKVAYVSVQEPADISDPVLRYQCDPSTLLPTLDTPASAAACSTAGMDCCAHRALLGNANRLRYSGCC